MTRLFPRSLRPFLAIAIAAVCAIDAAALPPQVALDILPGACPNKVKAGQAGVLPVSLLGSANFDVTMIDVASVRLCTTPCAGVPVAPSAVSYSYQDTSTPFSGAACGCNSLGGDGFTDLRLKFDRIAVSNALGLAGLPNNTVVTVVVDGVFVNGVSFSATDCIQVTKSNANNDCDGDGVNDNHEADCDNNGTPDDCQIFADCNHDGVPDTCQLAGHDCNQNGTLDACEIAANPNLDRATGGPVPVCQPNGILDACEALADCDADALPDVCETDANGNGVPDECEAGSAGAGLATAGSVLLFPEYSSMPGTLSILTVTNTNPNPTSGAVRIEWDYHEETTCLEFNRQDVLTPLDTLTVLSSAHNPTLTRGFIHVSARDVATHQPISFNFLVGDSLQLDGINSIGYSLAPIPFQAMTATGTLTDLDADGIHDLDGVEYSRFADRVIVPRFLGQDGDNLQTSSLILIGLSGGAAFTTVADFLIFNDNEDPFSAQFAFQCWAKPNLVDISFLFEEDFLVTTNHAVLEIFGLNHRETGWFQVDGNMATSSATTILDPAVLAVLVEGQAGSKGASLPFGSGTQDNADLVPTSPTGDP